MLLGKAHSILTIFGQDWFLVGKFNYLAVIFSVVKERLKILKVLWIVE
jgi:hypothetical protein